jgi:mannosyl-3-phosphoglycerate phosphatase family protein
MLPPTRVIFTAVEGALLDSKSQSWSAAAEALGEIERRRVPLILVSSGTRAELEPLRRKLEHGHPFITESGGGLFIPDGYFARRLEGAVRQGRYFCVAFVRPYADAVAAVEELAEESGASIVGYSQMTAREIAHNTGESVRQAELARQREFSERFFFAGGTEKVINKFEREAREGGWDAIRGEPFWELRSGNDEARALRHLMRLLRDALHTRLRAVAIGSNARDLSLLSAADQAVLLPQRGQEFDPVLTSRLPKAIPGEASGPAGWNQAVLKALEEAS